MTESLGRVDALSQQAQHERLAYLNYTVWHVPQVTDTFRELAEHVCPLRLPC